MPGSGIKAQIRTRIWDRLTRAGVVGFPGAHGQTPVFKEAEEALRWLRAEQAWADARRVLVLSEPVLKAARRAVVADRKLLLVPDLARRDGWVVVVDPERMTEEEALAVATSFDAARRVPPVGVQCLHGREAPRVDLMVVGAVCVDRGGARIGKGTGEADLVYALGRSRGFIGEDTPVAVMVHELQVCNEPGTHESTDLPIDIIVTPRDVHRVDTMRMRPSGLQAGMITSERLAMFPGLADILVREGMALPPGGSRRS